MAAEQDRPEVVEARQVWVAHQSPINPDQVVFLDETCAKANMTRTHGRCREGE